MLLNENMKQIEDIRSENLAELAKEFGGIVGLAAKLERSEAQISQWINRSKLPSGKKRSMRSETARWIESVTNCPPGWLDQDRFRAATASEPTPMPYVHPNPLVRQVIALMEQTDEAGRGIILMAASQALEKYRPVKETVG